MRVLRFLCCLSLAAVLLAGNAVHAQSPGQTTIFAGLTMPGSDFDDLATTGYHFGIGYGIELGTPVPGTPAFGVNLRAAYNRTGLENDVDGHFAMLEALTLGRLTMPGGFFFEAGLGITNIDAEIMDEGLDSETDFSWVLGAGYKLPKVELEFLYHDVSVDDEGIPGGFGFSYMSLSAGLRF